jgi:hypothetical protein
MVGRVMVVLRADIEMSEIEKDLLGVCHKSDLTVFVTTDLLQREI